jgi:hypothetical protein
MYTDGTLVGSMTFSDAAMPGTSIKAGLGFNQIFLLAYVFFP